MSAKNQNIFTCMVLFSSKLVYKGKGCAVGGNLWKLSKNWSKRGSCNIDNALVLCTGMRK